MGRATEEKPAAEEELETSVIGNEKVNLDPVQVDRFSSGCDFQVDVLLTQVANIFTRIYPSYP